MPTIPKKDEPAQTVSADSDKKDPTMAAVISAAGLIFLSAPAVGYFYLGEMKKGAVYLIAVWGLIFALVAGYFIAGVTTGIGAICCLPAFIIPLILELVIVYDVYLTAKGETPKLPAILN